MNLLRRFLFFFFGSHLGCPIFAFGQPSGLHVAVGSLCYLPNCRVLKDLRSKPLTLAESLKDYSVEQLTPLFHDGDIDFSRSDTHSACRTYIIKGEDTAHTPMEITVESCAKKVTITAIKPLQ